ncbi:MAG: guanylate kinase [Deltaproteobacteria bacterium]|nr:guanylate kinase [Deltaproteobacteria bacterium]
MSGILYIVSAPSGVGKTTLINRLTEIDNDCAFAVSHTTREPRKGEVDGEHYYFVTGDRFREMAEDGEFAEWAEVYEGRFYGTSRAEIERLRTSGKDVVFDVDYHGGRSLMRLYPDATSVFVLPPSLAVARERLSGRGTDLPADLAERIRNARVEISVAHEYGHIVVNDELDRAVRDLMIIVKSARLGHEHSAGLVRDLVAEDV